MTSTAPDLTPGPEFRPTATDDPTATVTELEVVHPASSLQNLAIAALGVIAVVLRFGARPVLWLDEAQTVAIARLPLHSLIGGLRHDGAPPAYYVMLHLWMAAMGTSTVAVRALPALFGLATLPVIWRVGERFGGRRTAWTCAALLASSPFAVRYSTENRMYSLVILLALLGVLAVADALDRPSTRSTVAVAAVTALLLYTHYWTLFLVGATAGLLALRWLRHPTLRDRTARPLIGIAAGAALFVPWLPMMLWQTLHTSTPWSVPPTFGAMASAVGYYGGGDSSAGWALGLVVFTLVIIGCLGRAGTDHVILDFRFQPRSRPLGLVVLATAGIALTAAMVTDSAIAPRYTSVIFPFWLVLAALGIQTMPRRNVRLGVTAAIVVLGLVAGAGLDLHYRSQAGEIASALQQRMQPGDVVAYCPDQLGPAVSRLLPSTLGQFTFPQFASPRTVDWVDYLARIRARDPGAFASGLVSMSEGHTVWLVWSGGYRGTETACTAVRQRLAQLRPDVRTAVVASPHMAESETLFAFR